MADLFSQLTSAPTQALIGMGGPVELAILAGIVLLLFGNRLPGAAKSLGQSFSAFKKGIKEGEDELNDRDANDRLENRKDDDARSNMRANEKVASHS